VNVRYGAPAEEAYAIGLLQQLAAMCDETRRSSSCDASRITMMLDSFEATLATLAPLLERLGDSPNVSRDSVLAAAKHATDSHQGLMDAMSLELERLGRAIVDAEHSAHGAAAYANANSPSTRPAFQALG
jgi:hypothetical protein